MPHSAGTRSREDEGLGPNALKLKLKDVPGHFSRAEYMSGKVGQDSNYVAHRVEVAISSRESETRVRKLKQLVVLGCVVGFLLVAALIVL